MLETSSQVQLAFRVIERLEKMDVLYAVTCKESGIWDPEARDIDVFTERKNIKIFDDLICHIYLSASWHLARRVINDYSVQLFFYCDDDDGAILMSQWDIMPGATWRGMTYFDARDLFLNRVRNSQGVYCVCPRSLLLYKAARQLLWNKQNIRGLEGAVSKVDESYEGWIRGFSEQCHNPVFKKSITRWRHDLIFTSMKKDVVGAIFSVMRHYFLLLRRFLFYPGFYLEIAAQSLIEFKNAKKELETAFCRAGASLFSSVVDDSRLGVLDKIKVLYDGGLLIRYRKSSVEGRSLRQFAPLRFFLLFLGVPELSIDVNNVSPANACRELTSRSQKSS